MDEVDFQIRGEEMQFVEIEHDPGESAVGEAGSMIFRDAGIDMNMVFGDGAVSQAGLLAKLLGADKRLIPGESLFTTICTNQGPGKLRKACRFLASRRASLRRHRSAAARAKKAHCWAPLVLAGCPVVSWEETTMIEISRLGCQP